MLTAFQDKIPLVTTRQAPSLKNRLVRAKFVMGVIPREPKLVGIHPCGKCTYCKKGYIKHTTEFTLRNGNMLITWKYTRLFTCDSVNVLYVILCNYCDEYYLGKAAVVKSRCSKHASDVRLPWNSNCRVCSEHLRNCSNLIEPYFTYYPFYYVDDPALRHFMERRFINKWKPTLNGY